MQYIIFVTLFILLQNQPITIETINYLNSNEFACGFNLTTVRPMDKPNTLGTLTLPSPPQIEQSPIYRLAQWATNFPLYSGVFTKAGENTWIARNEAKKNVLHKKDNLWSIVLNSNGITEYQGKLRKYGEPWPHLLIEKAFPEGIKITGNNLAFNLEFRITNCICDDRLKENIDPTLHTAQISAFWTVKNNNPNSKDYKEFFWLGLPLFDARYPIPPEYINIDIGSTYTTNKLITVIDGKRFYEDSTGDGDRNKLNTLLTPLFEEALNKGQKRGYLTKSHIEDFILTSFNLGWKITGPYNVEIEIRNLSLNCDRK
ncbi:MAG: hypothetical protein ACP5UA_07095 [Candidatus Hydrogenedens sp.]